MKKKLRITLLFNLIMVFCLFSSFTALAANGQIDKPKAKSIALEAVGVKSSSVKKWIKVKLDQKDNEWEIKFQTKSYKYEVELNAKSGKIKEIERKKIPGNSSSYISTSKAKSIALKAVGVKPSSVKKWIKVKLDQKDNEWEIKFQTKNYKYEVELNAKSGKIKETERKKILGKS